MQYRYGFNGKEKDDEVKGNGNSLDYGARIFDPRLGRWLSLDPLFAKYPYASPYNFALNTPIQAKDPDGKVVIFVNGYYNPGTNEGGNSSYWKRNDKTGFHAFDSKVMDRLGDRSARYYDGALGSGLGFNSSAKHRDNSGYWQAMKDAGEIINGLKKNDAGEIIESVKLVSHSMGSAYAKGFARGLNEYVRQYNEANPDAQIKGFNIEMDVNFAPFQPGDQKAAPGVPTYQFSNTHDGVSNSSGENRVIEGANASYDSDSKKGHSLWDFEDKIKEMPDAKGGGGNFKTVEQKPND